MRFEWESSSSDLFSHYLICVQLKLSTVLLEFDFVKLPVISLSEQNKASIITVYVVCVVASGSPLHPRISRLAYHGRHRWSGSINHCDSSVFVSETMSTVYCRLFILPTGEI